MLFYTRLDKQIKKSYTISQTVKTSEVQLLLLLFYTKALKPQTKIAADNTLFFYFYLSKEIRLDVSCESSA